MPRCPQVAQKYLIKQLFTRGGSLQKQGDPVRPLLLEARSPEQPHRHHPGEADSGPTWTCGIRTCVATGDMCAGKFGQTPHSRGEKTKTKQNPSLGLRTIHGPQALFNQWLSDQRQIVSLHLTLPISETGITL